MMMPAPKPYRSKLITFEAEIAVLRRKRPPTPYSPIVKILKEKYGLAVRVSTLFNFVKVRRRWDRVHSSDGHPAGNPRTGSSMSPKPVRPEQVWWRTPWLWLPGFLLERGQSLSINKANRPLRLKKVKPHNSNLLCSLFPALDTPYECKG
jgi:hypothetical protein